MVTVACPVPVEIRILSATSPQEAWATVMLPVASLTVTTNPPTACSDT